MNCLTDVSEILMWGATRSPAKDLFYIEIGLFESPLVEHCSNAGQEHRRFLGSRSRVFAALANIIRRRLMHGHFYKSDLYGEKDND